MTNRTCSIFCTLALAAIATPCFAAGEVLKVETTGTEHCDDFDYAKFNAKNNTDLWVRIDDPFEITVSLTPSFEEGTTFPMFGAFYLTKLKQAAYVFSVNFEDGTFVAVEGRAKVDWDGTVTQMKGSFIQDGLFELFCFSSGKLKGKLL